MTQITVTQSGPRWIARFAWDVATKDLVKAAGFRFDGAAKLWYTHDPAIAAKLGGDTREAVTRINAAREAMAAAQDAAIVASRAATSDLAIPLSAGAAARGMAYLPYQVAGVEYALSRPATLIGDEMGLGKTIQALGLINADPSTRNVLVICPASLKLNWAREAALWLARPFAVGFVNGGMPAGDCRFVITNYEMVGKQRAAIDAVPWDLLIIDESHYLKSPKAQRTAAILGKWNRDPTQRVAPIAAKRKLFLSGTPFLNRPVELWTLLQALDPQGLGRNWKAFVTRYCNGHIESHYSGSHWNVSGASNLPELQAKLRASLMVRRLKAEVLTELPAKRRQIVPLEPVTAEARAAVAAEAKVVAESEARLAKLRAEVEALDPETAREAYAAAAQRLRQAQMVAFEETAKVRHRVALAKVTQVLEHVIDCLEGSDGKLVVWAHHHDVTDLLVQGLAEYGVVKADGRDDPAAREATKQAFQGDASKRVIVCGMAAMREGHTLTAASHAVFAELDWVAENLKQCEDRCHRIGQRDNVLVQHLVLDGSMDARMCSMIIAKMELTREALDEGEALPAPEKLAMPVEPSAKPADAASREGEVSLPVQQIAAIHEALRILAGRCDGARELDGAGFNKLDTGFGHELAARPGLSQKQAAAARRMVLKYVRQLPADLYAAIKG